MSNYFDKLPPWPDGDFGEFGPVEVKPRDRYQQIGGAFLSRNWLAIPHVTHHDEVDVTDLEAARKAWGEANPGQKITLLAPVMKAVVGALKEFPIFNTSLTADGASLVWKKYFHIGVAVDTPKGLLVGVVRDCDTKSAATLAEDTAALAEKARTKGLSMAEMSGGSMTISSLGHIGGTAFTPIVNAPEAAILGLTRVQLRPAPGEAGALEWRKMLPLSLSYDHRIINGADAARFVRHIGRELSRFEFV